MATLKRSDILRKHTNRGRPPKPVKERQLKQRAAYQWRDARRIYLAGSFERWRKLKSRLQLKDSSLAWHLLETHDKGCNNCSMSSTLGDSSALNADQDHTDFPTKNASDFYSALQNMLRQLCYTYLHFDECVEVVGLICVEIDHKSKDNHSIKEVVRRGLAPKERTHERRQSDLEASEAELVTLAMSRVAPKDRCADGYDDAKAEGQAVASDDAGTTLPNSVTVSDVDSAVSASHQCARTLDHEGRTSWDGGGEQSEVAAPVCSDKSEVAEGSIEDPTGGEGSAPCSVTVLPTSDIHSKSQHNYDETDHAAIVASSHHTDSNTSVETSGKNSTHALPSSWLTHSHGQHGACLPNGSPSHGIEHCTSCAAGELHNKVVVSGDGMVSHVVHNGPMSRQVYRIDLSNHEHSCDMEVNLGLQSSLAQPKDHMGEQSRDRAASIESTDSFMEVGILSQINHAQRLLASPSPTDQSKASPVPSPVVSLVADSSLRAAFDAFPAPPPDTALASESLDVPCSPVPFEASSHPNHTSVIKQLNHSEKPASHKTDPSASFREAFFPSEERNVSPARVSGNEGDLPLDMSVVKEEEEDSAEQSTQDRQSVKQGLAHPEEQSSSHDAEDASSSSLSPPCSMPSEATTAAAVGDASHLLSSSSSMEHLQRYTDRLLQQRHITTDLSLLHSSFFSSVDMDDATRSRKRKLSELDDGELSKGSPWTRKDMTQKEEYQFLERDPFMDFAEMTRLFPNMQQRTFYRWKRRIKDQFMFLEQQPTMTYAQFSQYFPQVREHVFQHWLDLLTHGHRFLGDSGKLGTSFGDSSSLSSALLKTAGGEGGSGDSVKDGDGGATSDSFVSQYIFLQKNPSLELEQFTKVFPEVPRHMFYMWKKQIFSDFLKLQANPKMTYQEFRKQASVTQDVYSLWKAHLMLMTNASPFMSTCSSLVPASSTLAAAAPTLPPVSLLASQTGSKSISPDLAAWYASYAPLMGQVALPFWSPLSIMSNPSLTATFSSLRDGSGVDQDTDKDQSREKASVSDRFTDSDGNRRVESESSSTIETGLSSVSDKVGDDEGSPSPQVAEVGGNGQGTISHRGRRQSLKPEHYFYLLNPDTPYLALTRIFPGVSAQRYGRWRRKVSSALAFLEREPNCSDGRFELYFPNVPDEILSSWRERVQQGHSRLILGVQDSSDEPSVQTLTPTQPPASVHTRLTSPSPAPSGCQSRDSSVGADAISTEEGVARNGDSDKLHEDRLRELAHESSVGPSPRKQYKSNREEYLFVQRYPSVDFSTFTTYYPNISVRTFYRWRRQVRDAINMLRSKPTLSLQGFQEQFPVLRERFPELTEEMFASWQRLVKEESQQEAEGSSAAQVRGEEAADSLLVLSQQQQLQPHAESVAEEREPAIQQCVADGQRGSGVALDDSHDPSEDSHQSHSDQAGGRSPCRQEQLLVHMNPFLDYAEMNRTFPNVTQRTFFRWKAEVRHVMEYMRKHPDVSYDDIASAVPGVSFQAFSMWQQMIQAEKIQPHLERKMDSDPGSRYGNHGTEQHDGPDSSRLNSQTVSDGGSVDGSSQDRSSIALKPSVESADESFSLMGGEGDEIYAAKARRQTRDEFIEVMLNPAMDYAEFARRFGTVSQRTFYRWRAHIRDWRAAIRSDPQLDYATFSRHARDVPEYVFKVWRDWESCMDSSRSHSTGEDSERAQSELSQSSGGHAQSAASTASQGGGSGSSEVGKSRNSKQLELMWMAYDYYQSHPTIDFKGLSALFPSVSMDMFQQWKKGVDVRMEYIRNIPSTNFEDFNRLFPDVKENIFNILKANVLSEKSGGETYYLSHSQSVPDTATSCLPVMQSAYSSSSEASFAQAASTRTSDKQDGISDSTVLHAAEGESTHQGVYSDTTPVPTQSSHLQSSHSAGSKEGLSVVTPTAVSIKQETSPNTPLPSFTETVSNLSNLSRLNAMFQNRLPQTTPVASTANAPPVPLYPHTTVVTTTSTAISSNFSTALAGIVGNTLQKAMAASSTSVSPTPMYPTTSHLYPSISPSAPSEPPSGSLYHVEEGEASGPQDIQASVGFEEAQAGLEERGLDTPGHSSQRQRKLQREEYMFVEQNPDVDVQEFLARFPKVSLRTFYRWKREIREEQQARGIIGGMG